VISKTGLEYELQRTDSHWIVRFSAMAGPCEILVRCKDKSEADHLASLSFSETRRIEQKFSRYRDDNIVYDINNSNGEPVDVDEETARLLTYAGECYRLSDGLFDITSGVLRQAWTFKGKEIEPDTRLIKRLLKRVGWDKVTWDGRCLRLHPGMEIDFGGVGKEYAVDIVAEMLYRASGASLMVNFGGDIRAINAPGDTDRWVVGIEDPEAEDTAVGEIKIAGGGVATSGDVRRYCLVDEKRLGHILNPHTGWPVAGAPRSVTVLADNCVAAGFLATLAMLHGPDAEAFLEEQAVKYHCIG
jgi:thiamine biosynthesis lipoprotein